MVTDDQGEAQLRAALEAAGEGPEVIAGVLYARRRRMRRARLPGPEDPEERECWRCREVLPLAEFARNASKPAGRDYICKKCDASYRRERR